MKELVIGGIKAIVLGEDLVHPGREATLAVIVHGRTRSKETSLKFASLLSKAVPDLVCAVWDLPNHGERLVDKVGNESWTTGNDNHLMSMSAVIDQGSAEAASLLLYLPNYLPEVNIVKRVIIGVSLGGYVTWRVATTHRELLTAAVPIITSPNLPAVLSYRWRQFEQEQPENAARIRETALPAAVLDDLKAHAHRVEALRLTNLPILAICGGEDPLIPPDSTLAWAQDAGPSQTVEVIPGVKHEVPREMIDVTSEYLIRISSEPHP